MLPISPRILAHNMAIWSRSPSANEIGPPPSATNLQAGTESAVLVQLSGRLITAWLSMARPNLSYLKNLALALTGLAVGIWTGLTGMGGALILSPALIWLIRLRDRPLSAVTLVVSTLAALFALLAYGQAHVLSFGSAVVFAVANIVGVRLGSSSALAPVRDSRPAGIGWSIFTLAIAAAMMYAAAPEAASWIGRHALPVWLGILLGGLISGLLGRVGNLGGLLAVPSIIFLAGALPRSAQATALAALVLVSILPAAFTVSRREAPAQLAGWASFGAAIGALAGSQAAVVLAPMRLVLIYGAGMFVVGFIRLFTTWSSPGDGDKHAPAT